MRLFESDCQRAVSVSPAPDRTVAEIEEVSVASSNASPDRPKNNPKVCFPGSQT